MHPLVASVLLGMAGLNAFVLDAELHPPHRMTRQTSSTTTGEGRSVVGANPVWKSVLTIRRLEYGLHTHRFGRPQCCAAQQHPAEGIGDRERIAAPAVSCLEVSFEVRAPDAIGRVHVGKRAGVWRRPTTSSLRAREAIAGEQLAHRARDRKHQRWLLTLKPRQVLARSPVRVRSTCLHQRLEHHWLYAAWVGQGRPRAVLQPRGASAR
ncbi:MAG: hypothetical protein JWN04_5223 [Myxococcaceae bacterium]|nr:hypothetical protein [Myxococcaceae bacterium]